MKLLFPFLPLTASEVSAAADEIDPAIGTVVMVAAFTAVVVIFAAFLSIVRKNKNPYR